MIKSLLSFFFTLTLSTFFYSQSLTAFEFASKDQKNALWAKSTYFRGYDPTTKIKLTEKALSDFATQIARNGLQYVYIFSGPFQKDGHLPSFAYSKSARATALFFKNHFPKIKILPWIGGIEGKTVFLESDSWLKTSLREVHRLMMSSPFAGVHIDFEYLLFPNQNRSTLSIEKYRDRWRMFHRCLRKDLPQTFISTAVVSPARGTGPWKFKHSIEDLTDISKVVDQVAFMFYDTNLHTLASYRDNIVDHLKLTSQIKAPTGDHAPQYLLGIGTFQSTKTLEHYRDMRFENSNATLSTLQDILKASPQLKNSFDGLAVYSEWSTTSKDWENIRHFLTIDPK